MRTFLIVLLLFIQAIVVAQERCATPIYADLQKGSATSQIHITQNGVQQRTASPSFDEAAASVIKIPVVVHVVYNNAAQNISDTIIKSQIIALTNDYRRRSKDTANTPARFKSIAADVQIEFYLATADAAGRKTSGIVRRQSSTSLWMANDRVKSSSQGGDDGWDSKSYLNIWVCNLISGLGYSSVPGSDGAVDGVVINYTAFGTLNSSGSYNLGRTTVHEVGHWLGLRHIWGDAQCGDDGIGDTPPQSWYTQGCPSGFQSSCNNGQVGDMYMNFMDYTYDACVNLFTEGQKAKMRAQFANGGTRTSLLQSKGLDAPVAAELAADGESVTATVYPNPATAEITLNSGHAGIGKTVQLVNSNGSLIATVVIVNSLQKIWVSSLKPGLYFIKGEGISARFIKL